MTLKKLTARAILAVVFLAFLVAGWPFSGVVLVLAAVLLLVIWAGINA